MRRKTTREILAESFLELAEQIPISKITITSITDNCGMSQPTFYHHFKDKYDLISWVYVTSAQKIMNQIGVNGYTWRDTLFDGTEYFAENRSFIRNALTHTSGLDAFMHQMERINIELLCTEVRKQIMTERIPEDLLYMIQTYCYGTVRVTCDWLLGDLAIPPGRLAEIMEQCLPEPLKPYLYPQIL